MYKPYSQKMMTQRWKIADFLKCFFTRAIEKVIHAGHLQNIYGGDLVTVTTSLCATECAGTQRLHKLQHKIRKAAWLMFLGATLIYTGTQKALAQTWTSTNLPAGLYLNSVCYGTTNNVWAVGLTGALVYSADAGKTWVGQNAGTSDNLWGVSFVNDKQGWLCGNSEIMATTDGGNTWTKQNSGTGLQLYGICFVDANHGWAVGNEGTIVATTNGGATWTAQTSPLPAVGMGIMSMVPPLQSVDFISTTRGWAVGEFGGIITTSNGGNTWTQQNSGISDFLISVFFLDANNGWAVGENGRIVATTNGGATWTVQNSGTNNGLFSVHFTNATQGWAVGLYGTLLGTTDGGATWTSQSSGTSVGITGLSFNSNGQGVATLYGASTILNYTPPAPAATIDSIIANSVYANAATETFRVKFGASISGLTTDNFSLTTGGSVSGASVASVSGSGSNYTVTVNTGNGDGAIGLNLANANALSPGISTALPFTGGTSIIDKTAPVVTIGEPSLSSTTNTAVSYLVTYADANFSGSTLSASNITLNTTGTANGTIGVSGSGTNYTVTISAISGEGTIGVSIATGTSTDLAGNTDTGAGPSATFNVVSADATLSSLVPGNGSFDQTFAPGTNSYTESVPNTTDNITITPTANDPNAQSVTVNGTPVPSGQASSPIALNVGTNLITVLVTAQDGVTQQTYTITVARAASSDASLSSLTPGSGSFDQTFVSGITSYTESVPNATNSIVLTPVGHDPNAQSVTVNGTTVSSGQASPPIALNTGINTIDVIVTAQDGTTTQTYTVTVTRASSTDAALSTLLPGSGSFDQIFAAGATSYTESVPNATGSITLTPVTDDSTAMVTVNGTTVSSGSVSSPVILNVGINTLTVVVTAQDGVTTQTYTVTVTRLPSNNASLSVLVLSAGTLSPRFAAATANYSVSVSNSIASITLTPTASDATASVTINGVSPTTPVNLSVGQNIIPVVVTAQDGTTTSTYTVTVTRAASSQAYLGYLIISKTTLSPSFAYNTLTYTASVPYTTSSVTITTSQVDANASVKINGTTVANKTASGPIALAVGTNTVNIVVTAQDGVTIATYTVTITRAPSNVATLSALKLGTGTLSPAFASGTNSYSASVSNSTSSITVTPTVTDITATVKVNGVAVTSGSASGAISLSVGANAIPVVVTAQDGTTLTYTVTATRAPSSQASLGYLTVTKATLSPAFNCKTLVYTAAVSNTTSSVTITSSQVNADASVQINGTAVANKTPSGPIALAVGVNTINIVVTAQDGVTKVTYTVTITRAPSTVATLSALKLNSGTLSPAFASGTTGYSASVSNSVSSITVIPAATDTTATITANGATVASGAASAAISLNVGANIIPVVVTAQDGITSKTYTVTVTRAPSNNAALASMNPSVGPMSPAFYFNTTSYTLNIPNSKTSITVAPVTADAGATIKVNGTALASGSTSAPIALAQGAVTNVTVVVTAQDNTTTKTYTIAVSRAASSDASLSAMNPQYGPLSPVFNTNTTSYTLSLANSKSTMTVAPVTTDANATITVNGISLISGATSAPIALAVGSTTINVAVTAQDGTTTLTYSIVVTRASGSANAYDPISVSRPENNFALADDGIKVHPGISPNGDGIGDFLLIDNISQYPDNKLTVINRDGQPVYEVKGYDNNSKTFDGHSNKNGQMQLPGTYFYQLDYMVDGTVKHKTGFIVLKY